MTKGRQQNGNVGILKCSITKSGAGKNWKRNNRNTVFAHILNGTLRGAISEYSSQDDLSERWHRFKILQ